MTDLRQAAGRVADEWGRRFARWDPAPFAEVVTTGGVALAEALGQEADAERVVEAYLRLAAEAVRLGYLDRGCASGRDPHLLARCLTEVLPRRLPAYPAERRLDLLARAWNLGEGLLRQPAWMARIASSLVRDMDDLERLDEAVSLALEPLLGGSPPSTFEGPFDIHVVDLRPTDEEFLPGVLHSLAPGVLCVHDRLRAGAQAAVLVARGRASRSLGPNSCPGDGDAGAKTPGIDVRIRGKRVGIGARDFALPGLRQIHSHALLTSGFVALSAVDSQRLWVVESAS